MANGVARNGGGRPLPIGVPRNGGGRPRPRPVARNGGGRGGGIGTIISGIARNGGGRPTGVSGTPWTWGQDKVTAVPGPGDTGTGDVPGGYGLATSVRSVPRPSRTSSQFMRMRRGI